MYIPTKELAERADAANILSVYYTTPDNLKSEGVFWYARANMVVSQLADTYGFPVPTVASVVAALSPRSKWDRNIIDAAAVLHAVKHGLGPSSMRVGTFDRNKNAAFEIAWVRGGPDSLRGPKIRAFASNIAGDLSQVTVDAWAIHIAAGTGERGEIQVAARWYAWIADLYKDAAETVGLLPAVLQAVTWTGYRSRFEKGEDPCLKFITNNRAILALTGNVPGQLALLAA